MQPEELCLLAERVIKFQCEFQTVEVKSAEGGCPMRLFDTISSFSNQDTGGIIIFGLDEQKGFSPVGVYDAQDLQHKVTEQCKQMEPVVRPLFTVAEYSGATLVSAEIPGVDISERPVFYKGSGRLRGSYIRSGEADELMSEYEIYSYDAFRKRIRDDLRLVENAKLEMFDQSLLITYLDAVKNERKNLTENVSDADILELMGVTRDGIPTLAGVLVFSRYPQAYFPQLCITAVVVPGTQMGETGLEGERFIDNKRLTGNVSDILDGAVDFVRRNIRIKTVIDSDGRRVDKPEFPLKAVREIILNALIHRDYSLHSENIPVRLTMYGDRLEVTNSGGLYGRISIDSLGRVRPDTRNPALANILELLHVTENRYSGIPTIRMEMQAAGLPDPVFSVKRGEFVATLNNNMAQGNGKGDKTPDILQFCNTPRTRAELIAFTGKSRYYTMDKIIKPLIETGALKLSIPDKPRSSKQTYYTAKP